MKIIIIEDERLTARDLANTIRAIEPDCEILPFLYSVDDAVAFFRQKPDVDLIFSDIELSDGLSFDIFQQVDNHIPVIFCTAYQQYTLEAFQASGIDYVLKPFNKASIERTLVKYRKLKENFNRSSTNFDSVITGLKARGETNTGLIVHQGEKIIPLNAADVALFFVENEGVFAFTFDKKKYSIHDKMEKLENAFAPLFFRANRQFLVNRRAVSDASQYFNRKLVVNLSIPFHEKIVIGKLKVKEFLRWLTTE